MKHESLFDKVELLQNTLIARATNDEYQTGDYVKLRRELLAIPSISSQLPEYVHKNRELPQFWLFINKFERYQERRKYIWDSFSKLLDKLEPNETKLSDHNISITINESEESYIREEWNKAIQRRDVDPEGAITSARSLIETVCKHILDNLSVPYSENTDIPKLYKLVADELNISPDQHTEKIFKQILGGCQAVVNGLGSLRNKLSDSHGKGKLHVKPAKRHAILAVNLAGTMTTYLIETYKHKQEAANQQI